MKNGPDQSNDEYLFLEGAGSRWEDLLRVFQIMLEFIRGFRKLHFLGPCVTVFGSARFGEDDLFYQEARIFGQKLSSRGFTIMTGGGPGVMEAANRGAKEVNGISVGCNIVLPDEQAPNPYLDIMILMDHFFVRKVLLLKYSYAYIVMPGGFGTMDELFETLVLMQTHKIKHFPLVLFGKKYWLNLLEQMDDMLTNATISQMDKELFLLTDSVEEGVDYILQKLKSKYGDQINPPAMKSRWWLFENLAGIIKEKKQHSIKLD